MVLGVFELVGFVGGYWCKGGRGRRDGGMNDKVGYMGTRMLTRYLNPARRHRFQLRIEGIWLPRM